MSKIKQEKYDVVIVGAGIGGLVCGCYLAKAGIKVLIIEKNLRTGGYCMSFSVRNFDFDACVHSFGSYRKGGILKDVLQELNLNNRIKFERHNPSDIVKTPDYKISFWNNLKKTIKEFSNVFPDEQDNIHKFFEYINSEKEDHTVLRKFTFQNVLDRYFTNNELKAILSVFVLGNAGLPASQISAFTAVKFYKEFMLDGGYYPEGGIQKLPDVLAEKFKELGGSLILSDFVEKVHVQDETVHGVTAKKHGFIQCKYVVSNIDSKELFLNLIGKNNINLNIVKQINHLTPSKSMFILYLGLDKEITSVKPLRNLWTLEDYDIDKIFTYAMNQGIENFQWFLVRVLADRKSILAMTNAPYKTSQYWQKNKNRIRDIFIDKVVNLIPEAGKNLVYKSAATPHTLYGWTRNLCGAAYGWAETPSQFALPGLAQTTFIKNLYQTGHWASVVQGVSGVLHLSRDTARIVIKKEKKNES